MKTMSIPYDEAIPFTIGQSPSEFEQDARFLLALKLFELRKLSAGKAAELSGIEKHAFLRRSSDLGVPVLTLDADQLDAELANA